MGWVLRDGRGEGGGEREWKKGEEEEREGKEIEKGRGRRDKERKEG